jgi:predicted AAA+ superfamily ATPase
MTIEPTDEPTPIRRVLDLSRIAAQKSHFLFGPRQTGKSFLVGQALPNVRVFDLLDSTEYAALSRDPSLLAQQIGARDRIVVIDEIQRLPELLNEVHRLIEARRIKFVLTGSSARRLRRGGVNLLGGRARTKYLHPLVSAELDDAFDLDQAVRCGTLPAVYFSDDPKADLEAYVGSYLQQEVVAEGATRNVPAFSRFLKVAALCNGTIVNFTNVASDAQVARTTVYEYFSILIDTLVLHEVPAWRKTVKRKPIASSKYYFFDVGVAGALQGRPFVRGTREFGEALETYLFHELVARRDYFSGVPIQHWRSTSGFEVDFLLGDHAAIEVKSGRVGDSDLRSLRAIAEEHRFKHLICVCLEPRPRRVGSVDILPVTDFLARLWTGDFDSP